MARQKTLKQPFTIKGRGLHTGLDITLTAKPAPDNTGIIVRRIDLADVVEIPALAENICETQRGTVIGKGSVKVSTIEHCMSAMFALGVDNAFIDVDAPEFPILDGSAKKYVEAINEAGLEEQQCERDYFVVNKKMSFTSDDGRSTITLLPDEEFSAQALVSYDSVVLNNQYAVLDSMESFGEEVSSARTFVFVRELEPLLKANLIKGGSLDNAIVIYDKELPETELKRIADAMNQPCPEVKALGYINTDLQYDNEPARHKLLDLIGDFALLGKPIKGRIIAQCPGHTINSIVTKKLRKEIKRQEVFSPIYPIDAKPIMDINRIKQLLPHRYPFLLVDRVMEMGENYIVAVKNVTFNEMHFIGHFPDEPVMPGVLHVEAMAQSVGLLVLSQVDEPERYSTYFLKIDNVKFRHKVVPGDTMVMRVALTSPIRRGLATIKGYCFVNGEIATEAEMTAQIVKNK